MILPPDACENMAALRDQIDWIDRALLDLLAERSRYIDRAIVLKPRENLPARTTGRVAEVIANVRHGAAERGLDPDLAERIWTELIEAAIAHEAKAFGGKST
ncbi:MAG TPA: chorismate mutase [Paracoccaceae bacterium]|nr:chorismate mutase [Paracoccaceae bacterium]